MNAEFVIGDNRTCICSFVFNILSFISPSHILNTQAKLAN